MHSWNTPHNTTLPHAGNRRDTKSEPLVPITRHLQLQPWPFSNFGHAHTAGSITVLRRLSADGSEHPHLVSGRGESTHRVCSRLVAACSTRRREPPGMAKRHTTAAHVVLVRRPRRRRRTYSFTKQFCLSRSQPRQAVGGRGEPTQLARTTQPQAEKAGSGSQVPLASPN